MKKVFCFLVSGIVVFSGILNSCKEYNNSLFPQPTPKEIVSYLASDSLQGRFPGTAGNNAAADYIAMNFKNAGLEPIAQIQALPNSTAKTQASDIASSYLLPFTARTSKGIFRTQNVAGFVKGTDSTMCHEVVIIGAHYDHLGLGGPESPSREKDTIAVHNGADDNASGCASVITLAYEFAKHPTKRSLLFIDFSAEEMGLIGSKAFTRDMDFYNFGMDSVSYMAMVNADMIGHLKKGHFSIDGTGTSPLSPKIVSDLSDELHISQGKSGYGASDHTSFYLKHIPVFFVHTPATVDYHTPADDADKLNYNGMDSVIFVMQKLVKKLGNMTDSLPFTNSEIEAEGASHHGTKMKVKLGLMPDVTGSCEYGMSADIVVKGKAAYKGGMRSGDIILSINDRPVKNVYVYMDILSHINPGQVIQVKIKRKDKEMIFSILPTAVKKGEGVMKHNN
ncbi:MAG: M28 family peptidase [Bacteroidales bacterium]